GRAGGARGRACGGGLAGGLSPSRRPAGDSSFGPGPPWVSPPLLRAIHDPPAGLFFRGHSESEILSRPAVAVVGARACSGYGASVGRSLARELAAAGLRCRGRPPPGVQSPRRRGGRRAEACVRLGVRR